MSFRANLSTIWRNLLERHFSERTRLERANARLRRRRDALQRLVSGKDEYSLAPEASDLDDLKTRFTGHEDVAIALLRAENAALCRLIRALEELAEPMPEPDVTPDFTLSLAKAS